MRQKVFALGMLVVVLLFFVASVTIPALQAFVVNGAHDLPLGLNEVRGLIYGITLAGGDPTRAEEGGEHPETAYPAKGSADEVSEDEDQSRTA